MHDEGKAVLKVVQDYARTWSLLQAYDEQSLTAITFRQPEHPSGTGSISGRKLA